MLPTQAILLAALVFTTVVDPTCGARSKYANAVSAVDGIRFNYDQTQQQSWPDMRVSTTGPGDPLKVCDCEMAPVSNHGGLLCDKEGYFIASFEAVGHWVRQSLHSSIWPSLRICRIKIH